MDEKLRRALTRASSATNAAWRRGDEPVLHLLRAMVDEQMHDGFWDEVLDALAHAREVRHE